MLHLLFNTTMNLRLGSAHPKVFRMTVQKKKRKMSKRSTSGVIKCKEKCIETFCLKVAEGPYFVCIVCNRCMYKKFVQQFKSENYGTLGDILFNDTPSFDNKFYICQTCHKKMKNNKIPCQAVYNKLDIPEIPEQLKCLNILEREIISKRLLFKKISIISKGQMPKIKGATCNIPVSVEDTCTTLPRNTTSSGIIMVKLKKKLSFKGHVYFEPVSPEKV